MAKTRQKKTTEVQAITEGLKKAKSLVLADLSPLKVSQSTALRRRAAQKNVEIHGAKKTLLKRAFKDAGLVAVDVDAVQGSVMLFLGQGEEIAPAMLAADLLKEHKELNIQGGVLESKWISTAEVIALSKLPSREQLLAKAVGSIAAPLSGLVNVLSGNLRNLVYVLNAIKDSKS